MNKTHTVTELPCGCVERRWLFGHDFPVRCWQHRWTQPEPRIWHMRDCASVGKNQERAS